MGAGHDGRWRKVGSGQGGRILVRHFGVTGRVGSQRKRNAARIPCSFVLLHDVDQCQTHSTSRLRRSTASMQPSSKSSATTSTSPTFARTRRSWPPASSRRTCSSSSRATSRSSTAQELVATYGPEDCFDGRSLVAGRASSRFVAAEEVVAYQLAKAAVNTLISCNATFGALLFSDLSTKLGALAQRHSQRELHVLTMSRVDEAFLRPAHVVDGAASIVDVAARDAGAPHQQRAGARRRAARHLHQHRAAARGRRRTAAAVAGGARDGHLQAGDHRARRAAVRCAGADDPAPGAPPGRRRGRAHRRAARATRPAELPVEPFLPDHRADRAGAGPGGAARAGGANHPLRRLAVPRRHAGRPDRQAGAGAQRQAVRARLAACRAAPHWWPRAACS